MYETLCRARESNPSIKTAKRCAVVRANVAARAKFYDSDSSFGCVRAAMFLNFRKIIFFRFIFLLLKLLVRNINDGQRARHNTFNITRSTDRACVVYFYDRTHHNSNNNIIYERSRKEIRVPYAFDALPLLLFADRVPIIKSLENDGLRIEIRIPRLIRVRVAATRAWHVTGGFHDRPIIYRRLLRPILPGHFSSLNSTRDFFPT